MTSGGQRRTRRGHGEGSLYWREDRQRWVVELDLGYVNGRRKRSTRSFKTEREAVRYLAQARHQLVEGAVLPDVRIGFEDVLDHWLEQVVEPSARRPATKALYRSCAVTHVRPGLGHFRLAELRREHLLVFLNDRRNLGYSTSTLRTLLVIVRQVLEHAVLMERVGRNVAAKIKVPQARREPKTIAAWSIEDGRRFLAVARENRLYALYVLLAMVGLRRGEVLALRWQDIDLNAGTLRIERQVQRVHGVGLVVGPPKTKSARRMIALPTFCVVTLREHAELQDRERNARAGQWAEADLVFTTFKGTYIQPQSLNLQMAKLCRRASLQPRGLHVLRHTAATTAYTLGVDWKQIQAMLGHSELGVTMNTYVDLIPGLKREAADRIDEGFGQADGEEAEGDGDF